MGRRAAIKALLNIVAFRDESLGQAVWIQTRQGQLPCRIHRAKRPVGTVVFVHGLTMKGQLDPRMAVIGNAFASVGYNVVIPRVPELAELKLSAAAVERITDTVHWAYDELGVGDGQISLMSVSFAAGLCLKAAAACPGKVATVLSVGGYVNARMLVEFILTDPSASAYGRWIALHNTLATDETVPQPVCAAVDAALYDSAWEDDGLRLEHARAELTEEEASLLDKLLGDPEAARPWTGPMVERWGSEIDALDGQEDLKSLECPVFWIHGVHDDVIQAEQSVRGHQMMLDRGGRSTLVLTKMLDHGNIASPMAALREGPQLVGVLADWLREGAR